MSAPPRELESPGLVLELIFESESSDSKLGSELDEEKLEDCLVIDIVFA